jgi:hypothetical protein
MTTGGAGRKLASGRHVPVTDRCGSRTCGEIGSDGLTRRRFRGANVEKGITMQIELARLVDR